MNTDSKKFLYKLLSTPSPAGFEQNVQKVVRSRMESYADTIEMDQHGNLIMGLNVKASKRVLITGHCDQIGFMVKHITEQGFIYVMPLGGIDPSVLPGSRVEILTGKGPVSGVIGRRPIHRIPVEERRRMQGSVDDAWIDIGAKDLKDAQRQVTIGDPVVFKPEITELGTDLISAPALDDKAGLFVALEALRLCARGRLGVGLFVVSTVQEEMGVRGATTSTYSVNPDVGIAVDVTHASDNPGETDERAIPVRLGGGPGIVRGPTCNPVVTRCLVESAKQAKIPFQPVARAKLLANDTRAIQVSRGGVATGCVEIPNRYMHTQVETCSLGDMEKAAKLAAAFVKSLTARTSFRPDR